jgi:collagen type III alpha
MGNMPGAPRPGGGPQFDPNAANRPKPGMGMLPTSPGLNKDIKDVKADGSPHTTAGRTPTATGTAASTPVTNPAQPPPPLHQQPGQQNQGPTNPGQMEPSSNSMLGNPAMSMVGGPQNSIGGPSADLSSTIFPADFLSNVASGLDDFDNGLFRGTDGDINFERDFGQWFNPEDVSGLDAMK